jgi:hypothetical protein
MDVGVTAIKTPGSAAAAFPLINRAPMQFIKDGIRYDKFSGDTDAELRADREFEIRRLSTAIDVPPEVLLGMAGVNHWGAWQIEESALKTTVTNLIELICWSLTQGYLQPALAAMHARDGTLPDDDELKRIVWYDLSELTVRPDRSQDALAMHNGLIINDRALLREAGFQDGDLLTDPNELRRRAAVMLLGSPYTAPAALQMLGITGVNITLPNQQQQQQQDNPESNAPQALPNGDEAAPPDSQTTSPREAELPTQASSAPQRTIVVNPHLTRNANGRD